MLANAKALLVIASCALVAHAQSSSNTTATAPSPSATAGLDACIIACVTQAAASNGCGSYTNLTCTCASTDFQNAALQCLQANCSQQDVQTAVQMQQTACGGSNSTSPVSTAASTPASSGASSASPTSSATSTSAAMALSVPFSFTSLVGTLVASAGALVGAAFVL